MPKRNGLTAKSQDQEGLARKRKSLQQQGTGTPGPEPGTPQTPKRHQKRVLLSLRQIMDERNNLSDRPTGRKAPPGPRRRRQSDDLQKSGYLPQRRAPHQRRLRASNEALRPRPTLPCPGEEKEKQVSNNKQTRNNKHTLGLRPGIGGFTPLPPEDRHPAEIQELASCQPRPEASCPGSEPASMLARKRAGPKAKQKQEQIQRPKNKQNTYARENART